jgi:outer membrane protein TolC
LNVDAGRLSDNLLSVLQVNPWMFSAALGLRIPVYTGGALLARIRIENARQQQAVAAYGSAALSAFQEVETALMNEDLLAQRISVIDNLVRDRTEAVRIATLQYQAGSMTVLWVLQLQSEQIASQTELVQLRYLQLANRIRLHLALGGGFDGDPLDPAPGATAEANPAAVKASEGMKWFAWLKGLFRPGDSASSR